MENPLKITHTFSFKIKHWHWNNYSKHVQHIEPENHTSILFTGKALKCKWIREIDNELQVKGYSFWWKVEKWLKIFIKLKRNWLKNRILPKQRHWNKQINDANDWQMPRPLTELHLQYPLLLQAVFNVTLIFPCLSKRMTFSQSTYNIFSVVNLWLLENLQIDNRIFVLQYVYLILFLTLISSQQF